MLRGMEALKEIQRRMEVRRGDVWMVEIPQEAKEVFGSNIQTGLRPCIIISGEGNNKHANIVNILPISSKINKVYPQHTEITTYEDLRDCGLTKRSIVLSEQMMTIDKSKLIDKLGRANDKLMERVEKGLEVQQGKNLRCVKRDNVRNFNTERFSFKKAFDKIEMINKAKDLDAELYMYLYGELKEYCEDYNVRYYEVINKYNNIKDRFKFDPTIMNNMVAMGY
ncbi:type II toxin-antitoxin system PemK/MazF family toxin [Clostridium botulinum]|nr:type II toxin-antitoxin system PemK/MazF family toxin [Clostridium botulinum]MCD3331151.1 type II toxin-antitoxin system PemK/MazF family toxin [Clostridium botulinum D/C]MCD3337386.1 type II toxin-antitoxin system PemK/MazF family toxin [Clostridium botulinum D/C]MCD3346243.1 type II toxin-antitoxin system PemK/MazF family toxin [Clostridium botulinum D/C]MCD3355117.1 type II toxin-antitoxin system PemK/MazF family toxin [Clostridium botulinum D/C]QPW62086.1 type II toxin-antitoxin system 